MKYTKSERKQHVTQQSQSGRTIASYCEGYGINYHTFNNWRRKYKNAERKKQKSSLSRSFVEVAAPKSVLGLGRTNIYLPNGVRLQLDRELDSELLKLLSHV
ncbi:transposase [Membranicola marinus]|uniref:Transposase n=1 Tax=Membranihabitans marinus TaxID=1227546 RepID=A0A953HX50_9BACT|nr:transposase [Membranihabitans marinus]